MIIYLIKGIMFKIETTVYPSQYIHNSKVIFFRFFQNISILNAEYFEKLKNLSDIIKKYGVGIGNNPGTIGNEIKQTHTGKTLENSTPEQHRDAAKATQGLYLDYARLHGSDRYRYR